MRLFIIRIFLFLVFFASTTMVTMASSASHSQYFILAQKYDKMMSKEVMDVAASFEKKGDKEKAIVLYTLIGNRFTDTMPEEEKQLCVLAHVKAGSIYLDCAQHIRALETEVEGLKMVERCIDKKYKSQLYNMIGVVYGYFMDYEVASVYYKKAYIYSRKYPDRVTEYKALFNLIIAYVYMNNLSEAKKYYEISEKVRDRNDDFSTYMSGYMKAKIGMEEGKYREEAGRLKALAAYSEEKKLKPMYTCYPYQDLAAMYMDLGQTDSVVKYLKLCFDTAKKKRVLYRFFGTVKSLAGIYEKNGDIKKANECRALYINIRDSIQDARQFDKTKNKLILYEVDKTIKEIGALHENNREKMRTIRYQWVLLCGVLAFAVCIASFLVVVNRQKKKLNESYRSLFLQNKDNLKMQKDMQNRLEQLSRENDEELEKKNRLISRLEEKLHSNNLTKPVEDDVVEKYQTSNLNEEGRKTIERKILRVMEETTEFCSTDFTLDRLVELVGSNSKYVSQVINDSFNKNFNTFVNTYRIKIACERLNDVENYGKFSIKGIAESVGFKSQPTFIGVFKKMVGLTPSMYQNMAKKNIKD